MKPAGFKTDSTGNQWYKAYGSLQTASKALEKLEARGYRGAVNFINGRYRVVLGKDSFMNPSPRKRRLTKKEKKVRAARTAKRSRVAKAAVALVKKVNPGVIKRTQGFRVKRLKGGGVSVIPVKIRRTSR